MIISLTPASVPTRSTSYTHLRDAFLRALQSRLSAAIKEGTISEDSVPSVSSSLRKLKGLFPSSSLAKHTPLDIYLSAPTPNRQRILLFRDLGSIEDDWVATEFVLHYFEGSGPSPRVISYYQSISYADHSSSSSKTLCWRV